MNNFVIGIGGGTGSGKTSLALYLQKEFKKEAIIILEQDSYYKDLSHLSFDKRVKTNFDHPSSIDFNQLHDDLINLINNQSINIPIYDFSTHTRRKKTKHIRPHHTIIVEGTLVLHDPRLRDIMDMRIFVDGDPDIRFIRRLERDLLKRARTLGDIIQQYKITVKPMHDQFVELTKKYADIILPEGIKNKAALNLIKKRIKSFEMKVIDK